ncbi:MAG: integrase core domain-containing protein [Actinomycetia bacterium]|nr:integrase core domain-containing protein [Actinomycetes bacterium]
MPPSRGRPGTALDNAMAESIMSTLKRELTKRCTWRTRLDLKLALVSYIGWYNARGRHLSPTVVENGRIRRLAPLQVLDRYTIRKSPGKPWLPRDRADVEPGGFTSTIRIRIPLGTPGLTQGPRMRASVHPGV